MWQTALDRHLNWRSGKLRSISELIKIIGTFLSPVHCCDVPAQGKAYCIVFDLYKNRKDRMGFLLRLDPLFT